MKITEIKFYGNSRAKLSSSNELAAQFLHGLEAVLCHHVEVSNAREQNRPDEIRNLIAAGLNRDLFRAASGDAKSWAVNLAENSGQSAIGLEVQVSSRRALIADVARLCHGIETGSLVVGVLIVPGAAFAELLPDSPPTFEDALQMLDDAFDGGVTLPIVVISVEHDVARAAAAGSQQAPGAAAVVGVLEVFEWSDIETFRANQQLQREHDVAHAKALWAATVKACPFCGAHGRDLDWVYFSSSPDDWKNPKLREGWIVVCVSCRIQTDFFLTISN